MVAYKILEAFAERFMSNPIPVIIWLPCILINSTLIYFTLEMPLLDLISYAMIRGC